MKERPLNQEKLRDVTNLSRNWEAGLCFFTVFRFTVAPMPTNAR